MEFIFYLARSCYKQKQALRSSVVVIRCSEKDFSFFFLPGSLFVFDQTTYKNVISSTPELLIDNGL